jgi:Asp-tRNA(Asn)/Glu-tRNA(Gln) amidotransferase A subunit family amidase
MSDDLRWATAEQLRGLIGRREISPVEVVQACLDRIEALEPTLHSLITVASDRALEQAAEAEAAVRSGEPLGPLHGVPVTVKDEVWTEGIASSGGSLVFAQFVPDRDGAVAERLRRAGAIIVGKASLPEFASWPRSKNRLGPESVNPWDPTRISGASSGGSAAGVAAGLVPLSVGSDGGGSIRIPSSLCGTTGLYPTPGRVPSYGSFSYSLAGSLGPIARTVRDAALLQHVIAGPDRRLVRRPTCWRGSKKAWPAPASAGRPTSDASPSNRRSADSWARPWTGSPASARSSSRSIDVSSTPGASRMDSSSSRPRWRPGRGFSMTTLVRSPT